MSIYDKAIYSTLKTKQLVVMGAFKFVFSCFFLNVYRFVLLNENFLFTT